MLVMLRQINIGNTKKVLKQPVENMYRCDEQPSQSQLHLFTVKSTHFLFYSKTDGGEPGRKRFNNCAWSLVLLLVLMG